MQELAREIGVEPLRRLVQALASELSGQADRPRAIELVGAINRLIEAASLSLEADQPLSEDRQQSDRLSDIRSASAS